MSRSDTVAKTRSSVLTTSLGAGDARRSGVNAPQILPSRDQWVGFFLLLPIGLVLLLLLPVALLCQGRPFLFGSRRAGLGGRSFTMWKIRTLRNAPLPESVMGAGSRQRVTPLGRWLRRTRIDELPQIINLLRGDMVLIGPRPPFRKHFDASNGMYDQLMESPPGITGLATVTLCRKEEKWLASASTPEALDLLYRQKCLPRKHRLDSFYDMRRGALLSAYVLFATVFRRPSALAALRAVRRKLGRFTKR